jgi:hypothetical protein
MRNLKYDQLIDKLDWKSLMTDYNLDKIDLTKKYYVFGYNQYYPSGGLEDTRQTFDNLEEAIVFAESNTDEDVVIFDREKGEFVKIK